MAMQVKRHPHAKSFLESNGPELYADEVINNLMIGVLHEQSRQAPVESDLYISVHVGELPPLFLVQTRPENAIIYTRQLYDEVVEHLCTYLKENGIKLNGVLGPEIIVRPFADKAREKLKWKSIVTMEQMVYEARDALLPSGVDGRMEQAADVDLPLISDWYMKFGKDVDMRMTVRQAQQLADEKIKRGEVFIWNNNGPVSTAALARSTDNGITINYVYTPVPRRNRGYATALVATLTERLLMEGKEFCALFTDISNDTSNRIYQDIGYEPVCPFLWLTFKHRK